MSCARCQGPRVGPSIISIKSIKWCADCEAAFEAWVRRHATDIVWAALGGGLVLAVAGVVLPVLGLGIGVGWGVGAVFLAWGTVLGDYGLRRRFRRRQFLAGTLPRAYLP